MKSVLVVIDSSIKELEHNLRECTVDDITIGAVTLAEIEGLHATMLKSDSFEVIVLHSKTVELEATNFGKAITKENGHFDLGLVGRAVKTATDYFVVR